MIATIPIDAQSTPEVFCSAAAIARSSAAFGVTSGPGMATISPTIQWATGSRSQSYAGTTADHHRERAHEAQDSTHRTCGDGCRRSPGNAIDPSGAGTDYAEWRRTIQRRPCLHQGADPFRGAGEEILRPAGQLHPAQEFLAGPGEAVFRVHVAGQGRGLLYRLARAYVDLRQGRALHRCALR